MNCPLCGDELNGKEEKYGTVYICITCGLIIIRTPESFRKVIKEKWNLDLEEELVS